MTNKETHLSKGTTKEGKEVVGYYYYDPFYGELGGHFIIEEGFMPESDAGQNAEFVTRIIGEPKKCLGIRDCEGELIFEGDKYTYEWYDRWVWLEWRERKIAKDADTILSMIHQPKKFRNIKIIHPTNKGK